MSTPYQPIYDCTLLFCGRMYRMHMPPLLGSFAPRTRRRGSNSQLKCLYVEESKRERKAVGKEACGRSAHSYIKYTKLANVYMCLCVYTSGFSLYLVLRPVSLAWRVLLWMNPIYRSVAEWREPRVFIFMTISLCHNLSVLSKDVL